jgi:lambda family phage portal protein
MKYLSILDHRGNRIPVNLTAGDYEGASTGRRLSTWGLSSAGPSTSLSYNLSNLRSRSRESIRNNPLADGGVDDYVATIIGTGLAPRWQLDDRKFKEQLQELWEDWCEEADVYERLSFYGLQSLAVRALIDAGEVLVRFVRSGSESGLSVPLQLQLLEADHLDATYTTQAESGNQIRMGVEVNGNGVPLGYWIWQEHPGETFITTANMQRVYVPKKDMIHMFKPLRAGQLRGRPGLSSILVKLHDLDQYDDAELVRKKGAAMFGGFLVEEGERSEFINPGRYLGGEEEIDGQDIIALEPGTFPRLPPGLKVEFSKPVDVGESYDSWMKQQLRSIAKGMGITYEQLTGDLSGVNFSSIRAGLNDLKRRVTQLQTEIIVHQLCRRVVNEWLDAVFLSNRLNQPDYFKNPRKYRRVTWNPDAWPSVNPLQDAQADIAEIRAGLASRAQKVASRGTDVETIDREQLEDHGREEEYGLIYSTNAGKITEAGHETAAGSVQEPKEGGDAEE